MKKYFFGFSLTVLVGFGLGYAASETGLFKTPPASAPAAVRGSELTVVMNEWQFEPALLRFPYGAQVRFKVRNVGRLSHAFVVRELGLDTGRIRPGQEEWVATILDASPGIYQIYSSVLTDQRQNMTGSLVIEGEVPAAALEPPALAPTPEPASALPPAAE